MKECGRYGSTRKSEIDIVEFNGEVVWPIPISDLLNVTN